MAFGWLKKAVRGAGKGLKKIGKGVVKVGKVVTTPITAPVKLAAKAGRSLGKVLGKVPVIGGGLKGVFDLTLNAPFQVAGKIAKGERLDRVALSTLKQSVNSVKAVAPYAQTVIGFVPGIGQGINAGIGAGLALASGQPITKALLAGVRSAVPGGQIGQAVFDVGKSVAEGKSIGNVALAALPIDAQAKRGLNMALDVTARVAKGENVGSVALSQANNVIRMLPGDVQKSLQVGIAVGEAKRLQDIASKHVSTKALSAFKAGGANLIKASPVLSAAGSVLKSSNARTGYSVAMGVLQHKNPQPFHVAAIRNRLNPGQRAGFDTAVATRHGMIKSRLGAPMQMTAAQKFGFYAARGVSPAVKSAAPMLKAVAANPATAKGATLAIAQIQDTKPTLWFRIKKFFW